MEVPDVLLVTWIGGISIHRFYIVCDSIVRPSLHVSLKFYVPYTFASVNSVVVVGDFFGFSLVLFREPSFI